MIWWLKMGVKYWRFKNWVIREEEGGGGGGGVDPALKDL